MKKSVEIKHPYLLSVILAFICLFLVASGSAITQILALEGSIMYWIMGSSCAFSAVVGVIIMKCSCFSFRDYGFCRIEKNSMKMVWAYIPLILVEVVSIVMCGFSITISVLPLLFFTLAVGFNEEIFFRGLILKYVNQKSLKQGTIISSTLFGLLHAGNLLGGADLLYTVLQIIFAFLVGLVLAEVTIITKSLWVPITWHVIHNFISFQGGNALDKKVIIVNIIQVAILFLYFMILWKRTLEEEK